MRKKSILIACGVAMALLGSVAQAEDLYEVYKAAVQSDPLIREAEARRLAALEAKPQARGLLLPQIAVGGDTYMANADTEGYQRQFREIIDPVTGESSVGTVAVPFTNTTDTDAYWSYDAQLTQTVFRWDQWQRLKQADSQVALAEANYRSAQQDLMVRVAQRYFDVLAADDTLSAAQATLEAVNRQLEQAEKRFEVGLIAITDVQEARAAHDSATAGVIAAKRALASAHEFLRELTGEAYAQLVKPADEMPLDQPQPFDEQAWVDEALEKNLDVIAARLGVDVAKSNVKIAQAGHMPTLDFYARYGESASDATSLTRVPQEFQDPNNPPREFPADLDRNDDQVGLRLNVPIFTGGVTRSQVREQTYLHRAERERLDGAIRGAERETRDAYLGVIAEKARVQALRQAVQIEPDRPRGDRGWLRGRHPHHGGRARRAPPAVRGAARLLAQPLRLPDQPGAPEVGGRRAGSGGPDRDQRLPDDAGAAAGGSTAGAAEVSSGATMATSRCTAPRLCATACRPRSPAARASAGSSNHAQTRSASSSRLRTMRNAPHLLEQVGHVLRVLHVRPRQHRQRQHRRLEQAVSTDRHQAAADEGDVRRRIERLQFAERIDEEYRVVRRGRLAGAALRVRDALAAQQVAHRVEALRMPRYQQQQRAGMPIAHGGVRREHRVLLAFVRAACDPHGSPRRPARAEIAPGRNRVRGDLQVELDVAGDVHAVGRGADRRGSARRRPRSAHRSGCRATASRGTAMPCADSDRPSASTGARSPAPAGRRACRASRTASARSRSRG